MSLRKIDLYLKNIGSPLCTRNQFRHNQETSFCICQRASLTVEAAITIPLVTGFMVIILFFFRVLQVQAEVEEAVFFAGRAIAVESNMTNSKEELLLSAKGFLLSALEESQVVQDYVEGGSWGISLAKSEFQEKEILLQADYRMSLPISFFGRKEIELTSQNRFIKWIGDTTQGEEENWVYITPNGTVFHATPDCRTLDLSVQEALWSEIEKIRGKNGQKYYPCSGCIEKDRVLAIVYYTDYGTLYHQELSCSALKRTIIKIAREDVQERRECSYCYP